MKQPDVFAPPEQRKPQVLIPDGKLGHYVAMNAPDANAYIVGGVGGKIEDNGFRWTEKSAAFQFRLPSTRDLRAAVKMYVTDAAFAQTGPIEIGVFVGTRKLDSIKVEKPGEVPFEKAVPEEWLSTSQPVFLRIETDKVFTEGEHSIERGVLISAAGFVQ